jgi:hypothetical protein
MANPVRDHGPAKNAPQQQLAKPVAGLPAARRNLVTHCILLWRLAIAGQSMISQANSLRGATPALGQPGVPPRPTTASPHRAPVQ